MTQALDLFQEGLDIAHENVLRCLELMWMRFMDDASHYNHITGAHLWCIVLFSVSILRLKWSHRSFYVFDLCHISFFYLLFTFSSVGGAVSSSDNKNNNSNGKMPVPPSSPSGGQRHGQQLHGHKHLGEISLF